MKLEDVHSVYLMGIGGIGMSGLARYFNLKGAKVSGYDRTPSDVTRALEAEGIPVFFSPDTSRLNKADIIIYTPAVPKNFPEREFAEQNQLPFFKRAQVLGMISKSYRTIAVAGTHGKTTTTGLVTHLLRSCGVDCTAFIGGISKNLNSNFVFGNSEWMVVEADEFDRSFLQLSPEIEIVTSMDADHLDIYGTGGELENSYRAFMNCRTEGGRLILNHRLKEKAENPSGVVYTYGKGEGDCRAENIRSIGLGMQFDYVSSKTKISDLFIPFPGSYNVENAVAAITVAIETGCKESDIQTGLAKFSGIQRRFDVKVNGKNAIYIDDYAHHPEEIRSVVTAVKNACPERKLIVAFQPHLFSRTRDFVDGFAESLSLADKVVLLEIYPAREEAIPGITSKIIFDKITSSSKSLTDLNGICDEIEKMKETPSVVMTVGAGDIDTKVLDVKKLVEGWN